jgi:hypothetical protein
MDQSKKVAYPSFWKSGGSKTLASFWKERSMLETIQFFTNSCL